MKHTIVALPVQIRPEIMILALLTFQNEFAGKDRKFLQDFILEVL